MIILHGILNRDPEWLPILLGKCDINIIRDARYVLVGQFKALQGLQILIRCHGLGCLQNALLWLRYGLRGDSSLQLPNLSLSEFTPILY